jgi:hypothetical protein
VCCSPDKEGKEKVSVTMRGKEIIVGMRRGREMRRWKGASSYKRRIW